MRHPRNVLAVLASLALAAFLTGCAGKSNGPKAEKGNGPKAEAGKGEERPSGRTPEAPPAPKKALKAAKDLKAPDGLDSPVSEIKMRRSWWVGYDGARVGDVAEYESPGSGMRSRMEVFDLADHAVMLLSEMTME